MKLKRFLKMSLATLFTVLLCGSCLVACRLAPGYADICQHVWDEWVVTVAPTCTQEGEHTHYCPYCRTTKAEAMAPLGHVYNEPTFTWTEEDGSYKVTVEFVCSADATHVETAPAKVEIETVDPSCTAEGSVTYLARLELGEAVYTDTRVEVLPIAHNYSTKHTSNADSHWFECACGAKTEVTSHAPKAAVLENVVEANCGAGGSYDSVVYCNDCNYKISTAHVTTAALPHVYGEPTFAWEQVDGEYEVKATFTCLSDAKHTQVVDATVTSTTKEATCEEEGETVYTVSVVLGGKSYTDKKTEVLPIVHEFGEAWVSGEKGHWHVCTCGEISKIIDHDPKAAVKENETNSTCTIRGGYDEVVYCNDCNYKISSEYISKPLSTTHNYADPVFTWTALTSGGYSAKGKFICITNANHTLVRTATVTRAITQPTCYAEGAAVYTATFTYGGKTYTEQKTDILPITHNYSSTYTSDATGHWFECACGAKTPVLGHIEDKAKLENVVYETCNTDGSYDKIIKCKYCEYLISNTHHVVPATGNHVAGEPVIENIVESTCTEQGTYDEVYSCTGCGTWLQTLTKLYELKPHDCTVTVTSSATCTATGTKLYDCNDCDYTKTETIPMIDHDFVDRVCSVCGKVQASEGLAFTEGASGSDSYVLSGLGQCTDTTVYIPSSYNGKPITGIAANAFKDNVNIVAVHFSDAITNIEANAFQGCINLKKIVFSDSVETIGNYAFQGCTSLEGIVLSDSIKTVGSYAFQGCSSVTRIIIGEAVTSISSNAFAGCVKLVYVEFNAIKCNDYLDWNNNVSVSGAFYACGTQASGIDIVVGPLVTRIPAYFFDPTSTFGFTEEEYLAKLAPIKSITFAEDGALTEIGREAFSTRYVGYVTVFMPDTVTTLGSFAFGTVQGSTNNPFYQDVALLLETDKYQTGWQDSSLIEGTALFSGGTSWAYSINHIYNATRTTGVTEDGFRWALLQDGTIGIIGAEAHVTDVDIPEMIDGKKVTHIGGGAFTHSLTAIERVVIPQYVTEIAYSAFYWMPYIKQIEYRATEAVVGAGGDSGLFLHCGSYQNKFIAIIGANVKVLPDGIFNFNFTSNGIHLTDIWFEEGSVCERIGRHAFKGSFNSVILPASLKTVDYEGFWYTSFGKIYYGGSISADGDDWDSIEFYPCTENDKIKNATRYYYAATAPESDGYYWRYVDGVPEIVEYVPSADNRTSTGLTYQLSEDGTYYIVTGMGTCTDTELIIPATFNYLPVAEIASYAFSNQTAITKIVLPSTINKIGYSAFEDTAFYNDANNWENGALYIGDCLIRVNGDLPTDYTIKAGTRVIARQAFAGSTVVNVTMPDSVIYMNESAFYNAAYMKTIKLSANLKEIGRYTFYNCQSLTGTITIPATQKTVYDYTFYQCYKLEKVILHEGMTTIEEYAFCYCKALTGLDLPSTLTTIEDKAFGYCSSLKSIVIPNGVTYIPTGIFINCVSLESITLPYLGQYVSDNNSRCQLGWLFTGSNNIAGMASVKQYYGANTSNYQYYYIPEGLRSVTIKGGNVAYGAFYGCYMLEEVNLPQSLKTINTKAFYECINLKRITLPATLEKINTDAFYGCIKLKEVENLSALELTIGAKDNGYVAYYAAHLYDANGESAYVTTDEGYVFLVNGDTVILCNYVGAATELVLPETYNGKAYSIGSGAFYNKTSLTAIELPDSLISIGAYAFYGCKNLAADIVIPAGQTEIGAYTFYDCRLITSINVPDTITSIGAYAFYNCYSITEINIPEGVTTVGDYAFYNCNKVTAINFNAVEANLQTINGSPNVFYNVGAATTGATLTIGAKVKSISQYMFAASNFKVNAVVFAEGSVCESIGRYAFRYGKFTSINLPQSLNTMEEYAFQSCTALTQITIPEGVTILGSYLFDGCTALESITLPELTGIGSYVFKNCSSLKSLSIQGTLEYIPSGILTGCAALEELTIPFVGSNKTATNASYVSVFGALFGTSSATGMSNLRQYYNTSKYIDYYVPRDTLKKVTVTGGQILYGAFYGCSFLTEISIPQDITAIGDRAFTNTANLKEFTIPQSVETVGAEAFKLCSKLETLTIKGEVASFGKNAFYDCGSLTRVNYGGDLQAWMETEFEDLYANPTWMGAALYIDNKTVTELNVPEAISEIKAYAFVGNALRKVTLHEGVTSIGTQAFYNCYKLAEVYNGSTALTVEKGSEENGYVGYYALYVYNSLSSASSLIKTGDGYVFDYDGTTYTLVDYTGGETDITLPASVNGSTYEIGENAFYRANITSVTINAGVTKVGDRAFHGCASLKKVYVGTCVQTMGAEVFRGCSNLEELTLPFVGDQIKTSTDYYQYPFGYVFSKDSMTGWVYATQPYFASSLKTTTSSSYYFPKALKKVTILGGNILRGAFYNFPVAIPIDLVFADGVQTVHDYAAYNSGIGTLTVGNGVTSIYSYAFTSSINLTKVVIGNNCTSIGSRAFNTCESLEVLVLGEKVTTINAYAFSNSTYLTTIYNLSSLTLTAGSTGHGYVACYAQNIYTSLDEGEGV